MIGQAIARRIDVLGLVGIVLFVALWQLLTDVIPRFSLPTPLGVAQRVVEDFVLATTWSPTGCRRPGCSTACSTRPPTFRSRSRSAARSARCSA
jgi:hypothetical protein